MGIRKIAAVWAAKTISKICRLTGRQGMALAGKIALRIDPLILTSLAKDIRGKIFAVTGTNGKTTTTNLLARALEEQGKTVICNRNGTNMLQGIVSAFVLEAGWNGKLSADYACLEVDEASVLRLFPLLKPDFLILTNLFRDQLDRFCEVDTTIGLISDALKLSPETKVISNADDPVCSYLVRKSGNEWIPFGISETVFPEFHGDVEEGRFCKNCGSPLIYRMHHYSQMGDYFCENCGFSRITPVYEAASVKAGTSVSFDILERERTIKPSETALNSRKNSCTDRKTAVPVKKLHIDAEFQGFYHIYNILAVYAGVRQAGFSGEHLEDILAQYRPGNGRMERFTVGTVKVMLNLAKNPAGFNQNIAAAMTDPEEKDLVILVNDNDQDGTDISWIWDVDFEQFDDPSVKSVRLSGIRKEDLMLRFKYAGMKAKVLDTTEEALRESISESSCHNLYVLANFTALGRARDYLKSLEKTVEA